MSEERTIVRGPNGEVWQEPPPNSPVQAKPGWLTDEHGLGCSHCDKGDIPTRYRLLAASA
jgi:hypothetical protein